MIIEFIFVVIFGLMVGSFLNVCIYRLPREESIIFPRSHCPHCKHQLKAWENIPVLSFIILRGRCSSCKEKISYRYMVVEILTAIIFVFVFKKFGLSIDFLLAIFFLSLVVVITFIDIDHQIIPNNLLLLGLIPGFYLIVVDSSGGFGFSSKFFGHLWGGLGLGLGFITIGILGKVLFKKESMGMGDVKYAALIGLILGWQKGLVVSAIAFFSAAILLTFLMPFGKISFGQRVPFGPFLSLGALLTFLWGNHMINWYLGLF